MLDTTTRLSMLQERFKSGAQKIYIESLNDALVIITGNLEKLESIPEIKRQIAIKNLIEQEIGSLYGKLIDPLKEDMQGFAELQNEGMFTALNGVSGLGYSFAGLPKETMKKIISMKEVRLIGDKAYTLTELFDNAKVSQINNYKQIIAGGLASNSGYASITKRLKDANAKATTNIDAIVHTAISSARDEADKHTYKQFDDVITGWKSVSVLDSRTSLLCASLDGRMYYKKQGYPTYDEIPNRPPRHFRCRSKLVPKTDFKTDSVRPENATYKETVKLKDKDGKYLRFKTGKNAGKIKTKEIVHFDVGQVSAKTKFEGWFSTQSDKFQLNYLGKGRYDLYKTGKIQIKDFIDIKSGERFTLDQIREKFVGAKITPPKVKDVPIVEKIVKPAKKAESTPKIPVLDFGYPKGRFNNYVGEITGEAKIVIDKLPKPSEIKHGKKAWYEGYNLIKSRGGRIQTTKDTPTFLHEYGHFIDQMLAHKNNGHHYYSKRLEEFATMDAKLYGTSKTVGKGEFRKERVAIMPDDVSKIRDDLYHYGEKTNSYGRSHYGYTIKNSADENISDIFDSLTGGDLQYKAYGVYGHGRNYYSKPNMKQAENFANLFSNWSQGGDVWDRTKKYFPNMSKEFESIMYEIHGVKPKVSTKPKAVKFDIKDLIGYSSKELVDMIKSDKNRFDYITKHPITDTLNFWSSDGYIDIRNHYVKGRSSVPKEKIEALNKLFKMDGDYKGSMYRGLSIKSREAYLQLDDLKVGDDFTDKAPSSWTSNKTVAEDFSDVNNMDTYSVVLELESKRNSAYGINGVSEFTKEYEVLYAPNSKVRVKEVTYRIIEDEKVKVIILEEY